MFAHAKGVLIVVCVLLCTLALMGGRSNIPPAPRPPQAPEHQAEAVPAMVEAFVVEVNLPALAKLGVSPIGEEPHAVSVADILKCLDTRQARVIAGAKAAAGRGSTEVRTARTVYVKRETGGASPQTSYEAYDSGERLSVSTVVVPDAVPGAAVLVGFSFDHSVPTEKGQSPAVPPDTTKHEWTGSVVLKPARPEIVAATQDAETATCLLLTAHLQAR